MDDQQNIPSPLQEPVNAVSNGTGSGIASAGAQIPMSVTLPTPYYQPSVDNTSDEAECYQDNLPTETRAQRGSRLLLIILAVIFTAMTLLTFGRRVMIGMSIQSFSDHDSPEPPLSGIIFPFPWQQTQRHHFEFMLHGDTARVTPAAQQRAIWEAHPTSKIYFANYIAYVEQEKISTPQDLAHFEQEISCGERLDPQNALYHYLLADALVNWSVLHADQGPQIDEKTGKRSYPYQIRDRRMLDRAMREYQIGLSKPYFNSYHLDMVKAQIGALPPCRQLEDYLLKCAIAARTISPELARLRNLARVTPYYAKTLIDKGRMREAMPYLESWLPFTRQITASSVPLIDILVAVAVAKIGGEGAAQLYASAGRPDLAKQTRAQLACVCAAFNAFREAKTQHAQAYDKHWDKSAGVLSGILLPLLGYYNPPTEAELAPSRYIEQQVVEEIETALLTAVLCIFMLYTLLIALRWRLMLRNTRVTPLLTGMPWREQARIILWAVILPLAIYLVYTRCTGLAGRELKVTHILFRMIIELSVISLSMLVLSGYLTRRALRRQYHETGVPVPPPGLEWQVRITGGIGALFWVSAFTCLAFFPPVWWMMSVLGHTDEWDVMLPQSFLFVMPIGLLILIGFILIPMLWERKRWQYGSYFGTLARTMLPVQASILLLLTLVIYPATTANERALLCSDRMQYYQGQSFGSGLIPLEERVVNRMRAEMLAAMTTKQ